MVVGAKVNAWSKGAGVSERIISFAKRLLWGRFRFSSLESLKWIPYLPSKHWKDSSPARERDRPTMEELRISWGARLITLAFGAKCASLLSFWANKLFKQNRRVQAFVLLEVLENRRATPAAKQFVHIPMQTCSGSTSTKFCMACSFAAEPTTSQTRKRYTQILVLV